MHEYWWDQLSGRATLQTCVCVWFVQGTLQSIRSLKEEQKKRTRERDFFQTSLNYTTGWPNAGADSPTVYFLVAHVTAQIPIQTDLLIIPIRQRTYSRIHNITDKTKQTKLLLSQQILPLQRTRTLFRDKWTCCVKTSKKSPDL